MKSSRKVVIAILIGVSLLFGAASVSAATHAGAVAHPYPTAIEY